MFKPYESDRFLDPLLYERKSLDMVLMGFSEYSNGNFEDSYNLFHLALRYLTIDFSFENFKLYERLGLSIESKFSSHYISGISSREETQLIEDIEFELGKLKSANFSLDSLQYKKIIAGIYILSYSFEKATLEIALKYLKVINSEINAYTTFSLYVEIKILFILEKNEEINDSKSLGLYHSLITDNTPRYAAFEFLELLIKFKKSNINYLLSLLRFYLNHPYSYSTIGLLSISNKLDILKFELSQKGVEKLLTLQSDSRYKEELPLLIKILKNFSKSTQFEVFSSKEQLQYTNYTIGDCYCSLIYEIAPASGKYNSVTLIQIFKNIIYHVTKNLIEKLNEEFIINNPGYLEDSDYDFEEEYTDDDYINDVFGGDSSYYWNIE